MLFRWILLLDIVVGEVTGGSAFRFGTDNSNYSDGVGLSCYLDSHIQRARSKVSMGLGCSGDSCYCSLVS